MKKKILILILLGVAVMGVGITYSMYRGLVTTTIDVYVANFIVDAKMKNHIDLDLSSLKPGDTIDYDFSVSNGSSEESSDVTINYNIIIRTMHFMPLNITLYDSENNEVMVCDETFSRDDNNELVCESETMEMPYQENVQDDYSLKIDFPIEYNSYEYSSLIDYLNIEVVSSQKTS